MIERIKGIRIKGRCFKTEKSFLFYQRASDRISIVYGKNGSGKTTISDGIACISQEDIPSDLSASFIDSDRQVIPLESTANVFVFNENYIDENVRIDDDGLGTIVLLGGQVNLQSKIDAQEVKVKAISDEVDSITDEYSKFQDKDNPLCPAYHYSRIIAELKKDGGWADIDSQIKGNKIKSSVNDSIVKEIGELTVKDTLGELQKRFGEAKALLAKVSDSSISYPNKIEQIIVDPDFELSIVDLLARKIEEPILTEREKLILEAIQNGSQEIIESARIAFSQKDTSICPYCYQPVTDQYKHNLIESINKVLNKDVEDHKVQLSTFQFPVLTIDLASIESLDADLAKSASQQLELCKDRLEQYQELIIQKAGKIYTPILIKSNGLMKEIEKLNSILLLLEEKRIEFNAAANKKASIIKELISINKAITHIQTAQLYKDYSKQEKDRKALLQRLKGQQDTLAYEKDELKRLQQLKSNIRLAIDSINNSLDYVFLAHGRLSIELRNEKYYLKSNGEDVLPKKVSQGERNIIALCYFFTQILANQEIGKLYQNEALIVIDDPISSFDFENKMGITSLLRYQTDRIIKGNANSKILVFSHDLETVFSLKHAMEEICKSTKGEASKTKTTYKIFELSNMELSELKMKNNEYGVLLKRVYHFANGDSHDDSLVIGNEMRRVLEAFSSFTYQKGVAQVSYDPNVLNALGKYSIFFENLMYRLVLHGESHFEEQIYSIHDGYHFYQFISEEEKKETAKRILCFMHLLNPYHVIAYLQTEPDAIDNIKSWIKDIPANSSFEITEIAKKRTIPLYSLPISAGVGKDSFEGIPYEDFETDNEICDFALKVSGDSMEPNIQDGSIVLVKRQKTIEDRKVGAFYYNGEVYCKYIAHENGAVYLKSYNSSYSPIAISENDELFLYGAVIEVF